MTAVRAIAERSTGISLPIAVSRRSAARQRLEPCPGAVLVLGLAEQAPVEGDVGVDAERQPRSPGGGAAGVRLAARVLDHDHVRVARAQLGYVGDDDLELDSEPLQDLAAALGRRGEDQARGDGRGLLPEPDLDLALRGGVRV